MNSLKYFNFNNLKYDLTNKFLYNNIKELPKLKKIILNFGCKTNDLKYLTSSLLALQIITNKNASLTITKRPNVLLKIRKGNPVGCKVILRGKNMFTFLEKIVIEIFPNLKSFDGLNLSKNIKKNIFTFKLNEILHFNELENHYYLFYSLPKLNITIITNAKKKEELIFIIKSLQLPTKN